MTVINFDLLSIWPVHILAHVYTCTSLYNAVLPCLYNMISLTARKFKVDKAEQCIRNVRCSIAVHISLVATTHAMHNYAFEDATTGMYNEY